MIHALLAKLFALLALLGLLGHHKPPAPAPVAAAPVLSVHGSVQCTIGDGYTAGRRAGFYVTCVVGGQQVSLGVFPSRRAAGEAIKELEARAAA